LRREAAPALLANVYDEAVFRKIYPDPSRVAQLARKLRAEHVAIFAEPWSDWLGTPLADHVKMVEAGQCRGQVDTVLAMPNSARGERRLLGWAVDLTRQPVDRVVITDDAGKVAGYALGGFTADPNAPSNSGWHGYVAAPTSASLTIFALINHEGAACPLGRLPGEAGASRHLPS
jgi:hypothetical protein